jgi:hypothetical protein
MFAAIIAKTYRLWKIFHNPSLQRYAARTLNGRRECCAIAKTSLFIAAPVSCFSAWKPVFAIALLRIKHDCDCAPRSKPKVAYEVLLIVSIIGVLLALYIAFLVVGAVDGVLGTTVSLNAQR